MWFGSGFYLAVFAHPGQGRSISCFSGSLCISVVVKQDLGVTKSFLFFYFGCQQTPLPSLLLLFQAPGAKGCWQLLTLFLA